MTRRIAAGLLAALVLVAMMTSLCFLAGEADHDCIGESCPVCAVIALCRSTLRALCGLLLAAAIAVLCVRAAAVLPSALRVAANRCTPVALKVKLLN